MLNENQKEAVNHLYGPCLVIAPPGSGKTKCLVERVVHLISVHHQAPEKILVVTFTKDAACEMKERFCKQFVSHGKLPFFGTFHSLFLSILKEEYSITSQNIISAKKAVSLLKKACQICGVKGKHINYMDILKEFSQCINKNIKPNEFCSKFLIDDFEQVFFCYQDLKEKEFVIDFDDMMTKVFQLFCSRNDILQKWKNRFEFILLDEMQDINDLQFQIISLLLNDKKNIFCVGDDDQSIYEFRGSKPEIMLSFKKSFPEAVIILLHTNYRSLRQIISVAQHFISHNVMRYEKEYEGFLEEYGSVKYYRFETEMEQAKTIISSILKENHRSIGVLYRNKSDANMFAMLLEWNKVPYFSKESLFISSSNEIAMDFRSYYRIAFGIQTEEDKRNLYQKPMGNLLPLTKLSFFAGINYLRKGIGYDEYLYEKYSKDILLYDSAIAICDSIQTYMENFSVHTEIIEGLNALLHFCVKEQYRLPTKEGATVCLHTFHGSKGLEYDEVYCININEGMVPSAFNESGLEEERRMFYVAITRAKFALNICSIKNRGGKEYQPSRFINEMKY